MSKGELKDKILANIRESEIGKTVSEVAKSLGISRITITKYMEGLVADNKMKVHNIGAYKLYCEIPLLDQADRFINQTLWGLFTHLRAVLKKTCPAMDFSHLLNLLAENISKTQNFPLTVSPSEKVNNPMLLEDIGVIGNTVFNLLRQIFAQHLSVKIEKIEQFVDNYEGITLFRASGIESIDTRIPDYFAFISSLVQHLLRNRINRRINFGLHEIKENYVDFKLGFVEQYSLEVWVENKRNPEIPDEKFLKYIEDFFQGIQKNIEKSKISDKVYLSLEFKDLMEHERHIEMTVQLLELILYFRDEGLRSVREWIHYGEWDSVPYVTLKFRVNHHKYKRIWDIGKDAYPLIGLNLYWEFFEDGVMVHCKDEFDFLYGFARLQDLPSRLALAKEFLDADEEGFESFASDLKKWSNQIDIYLSESQKKRVN